MADFNGGDGADQYTGTSEKDWIAGNGGDDVLNGGGEEDTISGGEGDDRLDGGSGDDWLDGGAGDDVVNGGRGDDFIILWTGSDTIDGGSGNDQVRIGYYYSAAGITVDLRNLWTGGVGLVAGGTIRSVERVDYIQTSIFADTVYLGDYLGAAFSTYLEAGNDVATGGNRADYIYGGDGNDIINGGGGNDWLDGGYGDDVIDGGDGDDFIQMISGIDTINGGAGTDQVRINYSYSGSSGVRIDLRALWTGGTGTVGSSMLQSIESIDYIQTSNYADRVYLGDYLGEVFGTYLQGGNDIATGGNRIDYIYGDDGNDTISGAGGDDVLDGGVGNDTLRGDGGNDLLTGGAGDDVLYGGGGTDIAVFSGNSSSYLVYQNAGGALFVQSRAPGSTADELHDVELLRFADGDFAPSALIGYLGALIHVAGDNEEWHYPFPIYDQQSVATNGNDVLTGRSGNDVIFSGDGSDVIWAGAGDDRIHAGPVTAIDGGAGDDRVYLQLQAISWSNSPGLDIDLALADNATVLLYGGDNGDVQISLTDIEQFDITFGDGNDRVFGGALADRLDGDSYNFGAGQDELHGRGGDDSLYGGDGADQLYGDEGNDIINGGQQRPGFDDYDPDGLHGGAGDDYLIGGNLDFFDGGDGYDRANIQLYDATHDFVIDVDVLTGSGDFDFGDNGLSAGTRVSGIEDIEFLRLGSGDDVLIGSADRMRGAGTPYEGLSREYDMGDGDDSVTVTGTLHRWTVIYGGDGFDTIRLDGDYIERFDIGFGSFEGFETVLLTAGHDYSLGTGIAFDAVTRIDGSGLAAGDVLDIDLTDGMSNLLTIVGGAGDDVVRIDMMPSSSFQVALGGGADKVILGGGVASGLTIRAGMFSGVETLALEHDLFGERHYAIVVQNGAVADNGALVVDGSMLGEGFRGTNSVSFDGSAEALGRFLITGGDGADILIGGGDIDQIDGDDGDDLINGSGGADIMAGGSGNDIFYVDNVGDNVVELDDEGNDQIFSSVSYTLAGRIVETTTLTGSANINATGNGRVNMLMGNAGNNVLDGGGGVDTASYACATAGVTVSLAISGAQNTGGAGIDTLVSIEKLTGSAFNDSLTGSAGNDTLDGGAGADILTGGAGNDIYYVDHVGDNVVEADNGGTDRIYATVSYSLAGRVVETLTLTDIANIDATGNGRANRLEGNDGNNVLRGEGGDDILRGGNGADILIGGVGDDVLDGGADVDTASYIDATAAVTVSLAIDGTQNTVGAGIDILANIEGLTGSAFNDSLTGNDGDNIMDGGAGADVMTGGAGDDIYYVDNAADIVVEADNGGTDRIYASVSYSLAGRIVETLTLTGSANIDGTGNGRVNRLEGNGGNNSLRGEGGNDRLYGGNGADILIGGAGNDLLDGGAHTDTASYVDATAGVTVSLAISGAQNTGGAGVDTLLSIEKLTGSAYNDKLTGDTGNNMLDGGAGADMLTGGAGDDIYYVDHVGDNVVEVNDGGTDRIFSSVSYSLAGRIVETLALTGATNIDATGNGRVNALNGNSGNNSLWGLDGGDQLNGGAGDDRLYGGLGRDTLTGGAGSDWFGFDTALGGDNVDRIVDFSVVDDTILLEDAVFTGLAVGGLPAAAFHIGAAAADASDRILYDSVTGNLYFDADGNGAGAAIRFAQLGAGLALTQADFVVG
jgi:Ca2+-binding RTX toxin-like protein